MAIDPTLQRVSEQLEELKGSLLKLNDVPNTGAVGVDENGTPAPSNGGVMSLADQIDMRRSLRKMSTSDLYAMFSLQAREKTGVPFDAWAAAGGPAANRALNNADVTLRKAVDTGGAAALIRQDLEPVLYELFVRQFPAWERFTKEPANGLVHAWNQITDFGDAEFMPELGTVTDDKSTYARQTTNIAIIATRRGVSLKSVYAIQAGGMGYNLEQLELTGALRSVAHKMQKTIFQGNASDSGGSSSTETGAYDANGFDGLRKLLASNAGNNVVDPTLATPENMRAAFDEAATVVMDAGGQTSVIYTRAGDKTTFDLQQDANVRYMDTRVDIIPGVLTNAVNTIFGPLPLVPIPGDSIGTYTFSGDTVADTYQLDESGITLPYLGSDGPTTLEIPVGISGQLTRLFIVFGMWGLAVKALPFHAKTRVIQPT